MGTTKMLFFIVFILVSFQGSYVFVVKGEGFRNGSPKDSIFEKISAFFGFKGFDNPRNPSRNRSYKSLSPAPAPAPVPARAPTVHTHLPSHRPHPRKFVHKIPAKEDNGENGGVIKRVLISVLISVGAALVIFILGFIWVCRKLGERRREAEIRVLARRNGEGDEDKSVKKVSYDSGSGRFYLESIDVYPNVPSRETASSCRIIKIGASGGETKISDSGRVDSSSRNESFNENAEQSDSEHVTSSIKVVSFHGDSEQSHSEHAESSVEIVPFHEHEQKPDFENLDSSFGIVSFHEEARSVKCESDRFISIKSVRSGDECSSEDESFHSFCDSHSSNVRLSNASSENLSPKGLNSSPNYVPSPANPILESVSTCPPPPPPLPPRSHISPSHSSSCLPPIKSKLVTSCTLSLSFSPANSDSSSASNQTPEHRLPSKHLGGIPPPPRPPAQVAKLGKDGAPLAKLKPLHWDKVRAVPDRTMAWDKLRTNSFEFDEEMMESLFRYNLQSCSKSDEAKSKSPSPTKHILEPKRLQNITILLKALNVTAEQVCEALIRGEGLCLQQLEALAKMVPTNEEEAKLLSFEGNISALSSAEIFVKTILNVPLAFSRIDALLYRETFEDEMIHLRKYFSMLEEACMELKSSRLFLKLLEAVLKTGNRMNVGTMRGGARAFKLDALLKLSDVKGTDGKTTLLHFVVQEIVRSEGLRLSESIMGKINLKTKSNNIAEKEESCRKMGLDLVSGLSSELCNVKKTATIDLDVLASSVSNLSNGLIKLNLLLTKDLFRNEKSGTFSGSLRSFVCHAEKNLKELREDEGRVLLRIREVTEYFHGNLSKDEANPLRIFVIVRDFLFMLDHVCKELRSSRLSTSPNPLSPFR